MAGVTFTRLDADESHALVHDAHLATRSLHLLLCFSFKKLFSVQWCKIKISSYSEKVLKLFISSTYYFTKPGENQDLSSLCRFQILNTDRLHAVIK